MLPHNITSLTSVTPPYRQQGAVIHSVATDKEYKVHYGVQSATFVRTVFPGQTSGTYRLNGQIPTWQGAQITASPGTAGGAGVGGVAVGGAVVGGSSSYRTAGSAPRPYPPVNASAYYAPLPQRIVPNPYYNAYG